MREESEGRKVMTVSEEWREKHEGRMQTVGVVRTQRGKGEEREEEKGERLIALREEKENEIERRKEGEKREQKETPEKKEVGGTSLGAGWEW